MQVQYVSTYARRPEHLWPGRPRLGPPNSTPSNLGVAKEGGDIFAGVLPLVVGARWILPIGDIFVDKSCGALEVGSEAMTNGGLQWSSPARRVGVP